MLFFPSPKKIFRRLVLSPLLCAAGVLVVWQWSWVESFPGIVMARVSKPITVEERLAKHGAPVRERLQAQFQRAGIQYPSKHITLIGLKEEKQLELWADDAKGAMRWIKTYPIRAASGKAGPKLREGDRQVPEGLYGIESLNPNSRYHLALRVNYPNAADRARARHEGRTNPGGDIMIHGKAVSIGCLAMGDEAAEELFVLAALVGVKNIRVLLCPHDLRLREAPVLANSPAWMPEVYRELKAALAAYPSPQAK